jgi:hypothetical protein
MYLTSTVALTIGLPLSNAVMQSVLRRSLAGRLFALGVGREEVAKVRTPSHSFLLFTTSPVFGFRGVLCCVAFRVGVV